MTKLNSTYYIFTLLAILTFSSRGQFVVNGTAIHSGGGDFLLTPASGAKVGSIWYEDKISLAESFDLDFELYFGTNDGGADGLTFCLQPLSTSVGVSGSGLGVGGVTPSFFAEFDTYKNGSEPSFDHVALQKNGDVHNNGYNNLAAAIQIKNGVNNVENGQWYPMQIKWDANLKKFDVYVDCQLRVSYTGDIINSIFNGDPMVYWGFTASTGGAYNEHRVRNVRTNLIKIPNEKICLNDNIKVVIPPTSSTFSWNPTVGIDNTSSLTPTFSPTQTTEYILSYNGFCNTVLEDTIVIEVENCNPVDTFYVCEGESVIIEKQNIAIGEWTGSEPFTKLTEGSINATPTKTTTYYISSFTKKENALTNGGFEQPFTNSFKIINDATVPGWSTTASDKKMEFWYDGFLGTPAYEGKQFVELNANMPSALYQDMPTNPGDKLMWGFAHRGRGGVETMNFAVGPAGGPYQNIKTVSTSKSWEFYSGIYEVPAGQTNTRFYYTSAMPGAFGNLLDAIEFFTLEESIDSVVVVVNSTNDIDLGNDTTICLGQYLTLDAGTGGTYSWSTSETSKTIEVSTSATYDVEVTMPANCKVQASIKVDVIPCKTDFIIVDTIKICEGETATIIGDGITVETWWSEHSFKKMNNSTITVTPGIGEFIYYVGYSSKYADSILVIVHENPIVNLGNDTTICFGEELIISTKLVGNYNWNTGENNQQTTKNSSGAYSLQFTDDNGCTGNATLNLTVNTLPQVNLGNDTTICSENEITLDAQNTGLNFNWNTSAKTQTIKVTSTGIYGVEVTDEFGCLGSDSIEVALQKLPVVDLGDDRIICDGETVELDALNKELNFKWNTDATTQTIEITETGVYNVEVTDNLGCLGKDEMELSVKSMPIVDLGNDTTICIGESVVLNALNPGVNYSWDNGAITQTIIINTTGVYEVIVSTEFGCADTSNMTLTVNKLPIVNLGNDTTLCKYQSLLLDAENPRENFIWSTGVSTQQITVEEEGLYSVEVRDEIGCLGTDEMMVIKEIIPDPFSEKNKIFCEGNTITLEPDLGYDDYKITWFSNTNGSFINVSETGIYSSVVSSEFCKDTFEINVAKIDTPDAYIIDLQGQLQYCFERETTWLGIETNEPDGLIVDWQDYGRSDEREVTAPGIYIVDISNEYCTATYQKEIIEYCKGSIYIPNAFTPNNDNMNDVFLPLSNEHITNYQLRVFNRWGDVVFMTNDIGEGWDGTMQNGLVQVDVYVYKITYTYISAFEGEIQEDLIGSVTVLK